jgi:hypothetical protein
MQQILLRVGGAVAVVMVFFFGTLVVMNQLAPLCPRGKMTQLSGPFQKFENGVAYIAPAPMLDNSADEATSATRSNYLVCENGYALGPAHTTHAEVNNKGKGRFSHWKGIGFVFSTSDNSDPSTNGRAYLAVIPSGAR